MLPRRPALSLESLDERAVPSSAPMPVDPVNFGAAHAPHHHYALTGHGQGTFTGNPLVVDAGPTYHLNGAATLAGLGPVLVDGTITGVGMISSGHAAGTLTLHGANGAITVDLIGPVQPGFSALPLYFHYHAHGGTGAYKNLVEDGTLRLDLHFEPVPLAKADHVQPGGPFPTPRGTFDIHI